MGLRKLNQVAWEHACMHVKISEPNGRQPNADPSLSLRESVPNADDSRGFIRMSVGPCRGGACEMVQVLVHPEIQ